MSQHNPESLSPAAAEPAATKRPAYKKKRFVIPASVVLLGIILGSCSTENTPAADDRPESGPTAAASTEPAEEPAAENPAETPPAEDVAEPEAAEPAEPTVGTPFAVDMGNGNVATITIVSAERTDVVTTTALATPAMNGSYLLLDVLWETESGTTTSNPFYFSAKDAEGRAADVNLFADNQLGSGEVLPGDKSRGFVAFDIAAGPVSVMISDPLLQEAARIQIPG
ncbi:hypothetical protein [Arthrobacter sp. H5]|uniref:hypothetical protein n=1 Tax=Arthrobacter sp. H5 TaxID=1267973 RepID=UPI00048860EC|nr:hypothetical protein [Arthrobacter sp. H5]